MQTNVCHLHVRKYEFIQRKAFLEFIEDLVACDVSRFLIDFLITFYYPHTPGLCHSEHLKITIKIRASYCIVQ